MGSAPKRQQIATIAKKAPFRCRPPNGLLPLQQKVVLVTAMTDG